MSRPPEFYRKYMSAVFNRGRSDKLPLDYVMTQAGQVISPEELPLFEQAIQEMVDENLLAREGDHLIRIKS